MENNIGYLAHGTGALDPDNYLTECEQYITADCGHEVYYGEYLYEWTDGKTICPDCMEGKFDSLKLWEKAELLGCDRQLILF